MERLLGSQFFDVIPPVTGGRTTWDLICQILWCLMTKHRVRERCLQRKLSRRFVWYLGSECRDAVCDGLQILDGSQLPLNTNDGLTEADPALRNENPQKCPLSEHGRASVS